MIADIPDLLPNIIRHGLAVMAELGGNTYFAEEGTLIMRIRRNDEDAVEIYIAERSTNTGEGILRDAQSVLLQSKS